MKLSGQQNKNALLPFDMRVYVDLYIFVTRRAAQMHPLVDLYLYYIHHITNGWPFSMFALAAVNGTQTESLFIRQLDSNARSTKRPLLSRVLLCPV